MDTNPTLVCRGCGAPLAKTAMDATRGMAVCGYCGVINRLELPTPPPLQPVAPTIPARPDFPLPPGVQVYQVGEVLQIVREWRNASHIFLLGFGVFWLVFTVPFLLFFLIFALPFIGIGIFMLYWGLAGVLNKTTIQIGQGWLVINHDPLPWLGAKRIETTNIVQLYTKEHISYSRNSGPNRTYQIYVILHDRTQQDLLKDITDPQQALYIEQQIERYLGIADHPVSGELPRY